MDRDNSEGGSSTDAKKKKYYCSFKDLWLKEHTWLSKKDEFTAKCNIYQHLFSVKYDGFGSVKQHEKSLKHQNLYQERQNKSRYCVFFFRLKTVKKRT